VATYKGKGKRRKQAWDRRFLVAQAMKGTS
jgi:hypothetical protein